MAARRMSEGFSLMRERGILADASGFHACQSSSREPLGHSPGHSRNTPVIDVLRCPVDDSPTTVGIVVTSRHARIDRDNFVTENAGTLDGRTDLGAPDDCFQRFRRGAEADGASLIELVTRRREAAPVAGYVASLNLKAGVQRLRAASLVVFSTVLGSVGRSNFLPRLDNRNW
mgnify:CR=1 FL=1